LRAEGNDPADLRPELAEGRQDRRHVGFTPRDGFPFPGEGRGPNL